MRGKTMRRFIWGGCGALTVFLAGCSAMWPAPSPDPWRYPDSELSANGCPDFSGTYEGGNIQSLGPSLNGFVNSTKISMEGNYFIATGTASKDSKFAGPVKKEDKLEARTEIYRPPKKYIEKTPGWEKDSTALAGCFNGIYIEHFIRYTISWNGEYTKNGLSQEESIFKRLDNGDVEITSIWIQKYRNSLGTIHQDKGDIRVNIIKRIGP